MTHHFRQRVAERISPHVCPDALWRGLRAAIEQDRTDLVQHLRRLDRHGLRLFRFHEPITGRSYRAIINTRAWVAVTVLYDEDRGGEGHGDCGTAAHRGQTVRRSHHL